jgi:hypothetical protein
MERVWRALLLGNARLGGFALCHAQSAYVSFEFEVISVYDSGRTALSIASLISIAGRLLNEDAFCVWDQSPVTSLK